MQCIFYLSFLLEDLCYVTKVESLDKYYTCKKLKI